MEFEFYQTWAYDAYWEWGVCALILLLAFYLGRKSKRQKSLKYTLNRLHYLHKDIIKYTDNKLMYERLHCKTTLYGKVLVGLYLTAVAVLLYLNSSIDLTHLGLTGLCLALLVLGIAVVTRLILRLQKSSEAWAQHLTDQIENEKTQLLSNVGPEVVDLIKESQDCKPSCRLINKCHLQDIERYKAFFRSLCEFQWCSGCVTDKVCSANCGSNFWKLSRELMKEFKAKAPSVVNTRVIQK